MFHTAHNLLGVNNLEWLRVTYIKYKYSVFVLEHDSYLKSCVVKVWYFKQSVDIFA